MPRLFSVLFVDGLAHVVSGEVVAGTQPDQIGTGAALLIAAPGRAGRTPHATDKFPVPLHPFAFR